MFPSAIQKLIDLFSKFPTVGPRTAARFVFYLIKLPEKEFEKLLSALENLKRSIKLCSFCFNPFDPSASSGQAPSARASTELSRMSLGQAEETLCPICQNKTRDKNFLCVVEKETDLTAIEKTKKFKGFYFILGGTITFKKEDREKIRIKELKERIKEPKKFGLDADFEEIIIATNSTTEGEATALLIKRELKSFNIKITRLGRGLPVGGELEYADQDTLESAFEGRK